MTQTLIKQQYLAETGGGKKRLWLQGSHLAGAKFVPGARYHREFTPEGLKLELRDNGRWIVSKKGKGDVPVLDILNDRLTEHFSEASAITIVYEAGSITVRRSDLDRRIKEREKSLLDCLEAGKTLQFGSVCHGAGYLDSGLHKGFERAGLPSHIKMAVEMNGRYLASSIRNNTFWADDAILIESPLELYMLDQARKSTLHGCFASLPCVGASPAGRAKLKLKHAEDHETAGAVFAYFLQFVTVTNPALIIMENTPLYAKSASWSVTRAMLTTLGYNLHYREMNGNDFGALEGRTRMVAVAVSRGLERHAAFDIDAVVSTRQKPEWLSDVLDPVPLDSPEWKKCQYLKDKEARDIASGKGFRTNFVVPEATATVNTLGRGYFKRRSCELMIRHPKNPQLLRLLRPAEHARVKGISEHLLAGETSATILHEQLGQAGIPHKFEALAVALTAWLRTVQRANAVSDQKAHAAVAELKKELFPARTQQPVTCHTNQLALFH